MFDGDIELDESDFDDVRKGKRAGKVIAFGVFGILKRYGKVYTAVEGTDTHYFQQNQA